MSRLDRSDTLHILPTIFAPVLFVWAFLIPAALISAEDWPTTRIEWCAFLIVCVLITVMVAKSRVALLYVRGPDWLAISFSLMDLFFAVFFIWVLALRIFPTFRLSRPIAVRNITDGIYMMIGLAAIWFLWELARAVVDGEIRRRLNREERARGVLPPMDSSKTVILAVLFALALGVIVGLVIQHRLWQHSHEELNDLIHSFWHKTKEKTEEVALWRP